MKKRIACVSVLVFWCLLMCTVISLKMQEVMKIEVITAAPDKKGFLPDEVLFTDDEGTHIYIIENGDEWTPGLRVHEANHGAYTIGPKGVWFEGERVTCIRFASRPFKIDDAVKLAPKYDAVEDTYVINKDPSQTVQVTRTTDFIESQARQELGLDENVSVYSMADRKQFHLQLVLIGALALQCIFVLGLGITTCIRLPKLLEKRYAVMWRCVISGIVTVSMMVGIYLIDIPASVI